MQKSDCTHAAIYELAGIMHIYKLLLFCPKFHNRPCILSVGWCAFSGVLSKLSPSASRSCRSAVNQMRCCVVYCVFPGPVDMSDWLIGISSLSTAVRVTTCARRRRKAEANSTVAEHCFSWKIQQTIHLSVFPVVVDFFFTLSLPSRPTAVIRLTGCCT